MTIPLAIAIVMWSLNALLVVMMCWLLMSMVIGDINVVDRRMRDWTYFTCVPVVLTILHQIAVLIGKAP